MAGLSTHVLDTSKGKPAVELKIELYKILDIEKILIKTVLTPLPIITFLKRKFDE